MTADLFSQIVAATACAAVLWRCEPAINRMRAGTSPLLLQAAFWCLAVSALVASAMLALGEIPPWPATVGAIGVALMLACERRIRYLSKIPPRCHDQKRP